MRGARLAQILLDDEPLAYWVQKDKELTDEDQPTVEAALKRVRLLGIPAHRDVEAHSCLTCVSDLLSHPGQ